MISVVVVTYNSMRYFPDFLESILAQDFWENYDIDPEVIVVDNASNDKTPKHIGDTFPHVTVLRNVNNQGLCRAWNQGISLSNREFILVMNPDIILEPDYLTELYEIAKKDSSIGSLGGKLRRLRVSNVEEAGMNLLEKTDFLDSCGLVGLKSRRFIERGSGENDKGQYEKTEEVFGISGACVMYRRKALEAVKFVKEYFDERFFMYKEDIDMAWRLQNAGYKSIYVPSAIGYHDRRARSQKIKTKYLNLLKYRRRKDSFVNNYSYRNHLWLLLKNETITNFWRSFFPIMFYELQKFFYVLIFENSTWRLALRDWFRHRREFRKKRRLNKNIRKISSESMRSWFV